MTSGAGAVAGAPAPAVQAAGGVLWRRGRWNRMEIALVHRPRYDDWSLPKGKAKRSENLMVTALREVEEETGTAPRLGPFLTRFSYTPGVAKTAKVASPARAANPPRVGTPAAARTKLVGYWAMAAVGQDRFVPGDEVDALEWLTLEQARDRLSYPLDRTVLDRFARTPLDTVSVVVTRAANAPGGQSAGLRTLDERGRAQAAGLLPVLRATEPELLFAATPSRCVETLLPAAGELGRAVEVDPALDAVAPPDPATGAPDESAAGAEAWPNLGTAALRAVRAATTGHGVALCVPGSTVPGLVRLLAERAGGPDLGEIRLRKGGWWVMHLSGGRYVSAERHDP